MGSGSDLKTWWRRCTSIASAGLMAIALWLWPLPAMAEASHAGGLAPLLWERTIAMGQAPDESASDVPTEVNDLPATDATSDFVPGQILVKYRDGEQAAALTESLLSERARLVQPPSAGNSPALIQLNDLEDLSPEAAKARTLEAIAELEASDDVIYAEPNFVYSIQ